MVQDAYLIQNFVCTYLKMTRSGNATMKNSTELQAMKWNGTIKALYRATSDEKQRPR